MVKRDGSEAELAAEGETAPRSDADDEGPYPLPRTDAEKIELLRAGHVAICRLLTAIRLLTEMGEDELGNTRDVVLDTAQEEAVLLFEMIANYLPEVLKVNPAMWASEGAFDEAYNRIRKAKHEGRFAL